MVRTMSAQYSESVDPVAVGGYWRDRFAATLRDFADVRAARPGRFVDVRFLDMLADPAAEARRVLGELGLPPDAADDAAFDAYLEVNREEKRGAHSYTAADFGLSTERLERDFAFYTEVYL
jgi:hypothetical protein